MDSEKVVPEMLSGSEFEEAESMKTRYNLSAYNIPRFSIRPMRIVRNVAFQMVAVIGKSNYLPIVRNISYSVHGTFRPVLLMRFSRTIQFEMSGTMNLQLQVHLQRDIFFKMASQIFVGKYATRKEEDVDFEIKSALHVGKTMFDRRAVDMSIVANLFVGKFMPREPIYIAWYFTSFILMGLRRYALLGLDVTIPPGGEIRINSEAFTALLGTQGVLHLYQGDWIMLHRNTTQIRIETGSGGRLEGEILYHERFK